LANNHLGFSTPFRGGGPPLGFVGRVFFWGAGGPSHMVQNEKKNGFFSGRFFFFRTRVSPKGFPPPPTKRTFPNNLKSPSSPIPPPPPPSLPGFPPPPLGPPPPPHWGGNNTRFSPSFSPIGKKTGVFSPVPPPRTWGLVWGGGGSFWPRFRGGAPPRGQDGALWAPTKAPTNRVPPT